MNLASEITYYLTLLEQMIVFTFVYHHICTPKKPYWLTVGFYFSCVALLHIAFLPFGSRSMNSTLPHILLLMAQFPVLLLYNEGWKKRIIIFASNVIIQSVTETLCVLAFAAITDTPFIEYTQTDVNEMSLACARIFIIDIFMLIAVILILIIRREKSLFRDMALIFGFVSGHLIFMSTYLHFVHNTLTEIGALLQLSFQTMFCVLLIIQYYGSLKRRKLLQEAAEVKALRLKMESNEAYYKLAESKFAEISKLRHDFQTQLQTVSVLLQEPDGTLPSQKILETLSQRLENTKAPVFCENHTLNAVLSAKLGDERYDRLSPEIMLYDCNGLPYDDYDLCSLISNLFDNAAESCLRESHPEQTVLSLKAGIRTGCFVIRCVNTCTVPSKKGESIKAEAGHGYGTAIIQDICKKYDGEYTIRYENGQAVATVILQLTE